MVLILSSRYTTRNTDNLHFKDLATQLLQNSERYVPSWLPEGERVGREWIAKNPKRNDRNLGSFSINLVSGKWADFATGDWGGDLISLYAYLNGVRQFEAARQLLIEGVQ